MHISKLESQFKKAIDGFSKPNTPIVVACSGGKDSIALAYAAKKWSKNTVHIINIDHGLQDKTAQVAKDLGVWCTEQNLDYQTHALNLGVANENVSRAARYKILLAEATNLKADLWTGHNQNDQAETVLLRLIRGGGTSSLAGIYQKSERETVTIMRPFLNITRKQIDEYVSLHNLLYFDDPHNYQTKYLRSAVRQDLTLLEKNLPNIRADLARTASRCQNDLETINWARQQAFHQAKDITSEGAPALNVSYLQTLPEALIKELLKMFLEPQASKNKQLSFAHINALTLLVADFSRAKSYSIPGGTVSFDKKGKQKLLVFTPDSGPIRP